MTWRGWENFQPQERERQAPKRNKFNAQRTEVDGITFDSKREARRYQQLKSMQLAGHITGLECQPCYALTTRSYLGRSEVVGEYVADFRYLDLRTAETTIEDVKSPATRTPLYSWKKRHVEMEYGITVIEI